LEQQHCTLKNVHHSEASSIALKEGSEQSDVVSFPVVGRSNAPGNGPPHYHKINGSTLAGVTSGGLRIGNTEAFAMCRG